MKKQYFKALSLTLVAAIGLTGCDGLGKLVKNADKITYKVSPEVLGEHGDSVTFTIKGTYPAKVFPKKAIVTTTPVLVYKGGEMAFKPVTLIGEQVQGKGTKIAYEKGGNFSHTSNKIAYTPEMKVATLELRTSGQVKSKTKALPAKKVADGVIATPLLVISDDKVILGKDNFQKVVPGVKTINIFFVIDESRVLVSKISSKIASTYNYNSSAVGISGKNAEQLESLKTFLKEGVAKGFVFKGAKVSAYASPDGELTINTKLAEERAVNAIKEMVKLFKDKTMKVDTAAMESFYTKVTTAEDWDGFKTAMEASSIADKDLILRVLTMYPDGETREKEIKNLSATYTEVADKILPQLRRSVITFEYEEKSKTDDQLSKLAATANDTSLNVEELLYAASLTEDLGAKLEIYKRAHQKFPGDWRTSNNVGYVLVLQNQLDEAEAAFKKADTLKADNAIVKNNLGVVARKKGKRADAMGLYASASGAGSEVSYNMGIVEIQNGNYANAVTNFGDNNSFNAALAKLLNGTPDDAMSAIDNSNDKESALAYYLRAVIGARKNSADIVLTNLKLAIEKDASLKDMAANDAEFIKFKDNADFKSAIQ